MAGSDRSFTASAGFFGPSNPVMSLPAGSYTLTISGAAQAAGPYSFRLSDLASGTTLSFGTAVHGNLKPAHSTDLYQFPANARDTHAFLPTVAKSPGPPTLPLMH